MKYGSNLLVYQHYETVFFVLIIKITTLQLVGKYPYVYSISISLIIPTLQAYPSYFSYGSPCLYSVCTPHNDQTALDTFAESSTLQTKMIN